MNLRQIVRAFRTGVVGGLASPEVEFISLRTTNLSATGVTRRGVPITLVYGVAIPLDASLGNRFLVTPTDGVAFAISIPTNSPGVQVRSQRLIINVINTFGVLGALTFTGGVLGFRIGAAWVQPAVGFNRSIEFEWSPGVWQEVSRSAADVAN